MFLLSRAVRVGVVIYVSVTAMIVTIPSQAQEAMEEIVVTGSLIHRDSVYSGRAPVQTIGSEQLEITGVVQPGDLLKNLTVNTGSNLASVQTEMQGTSQFSLRGLGLSSTLTLINGRRGGFAPVGDNAANTFLDINTLPATMIRRIEVLTDGASATYGSQAVAGVANIITRKGFEGFELSGGARDASNDSYDVGFALGKSFDGGLFNLYGTHYRQDENFRTDFDWIRTRLYDPNGDGNIADGAFTSLLGSPGSYRRAVANSDGTFSPFAGASFSPDADCAAAGGVPFGPLCSLDFADQRTIIAAEQRYQIFGEAEYRLSDEITFFTEFGFSNNTVTDRIGAQIFRTGNVGGTGDTYIPANHPFNFWTDPDNDGVLTYVDPASWDPTVDEAVGVGCLCRPLGLEVNGDNAGDEEREFNNFRIMMGLDVVLGERWKGSGYYSLARSKFTETSDHVYISDQFNKVVSDGIWNPFGTRLANPDLVTPKTPAGDGLNPGLVGVTAGNTQDVQALFDGVSVETARSEEQVLEFIVTGDALEIGSMPLPVALGAQYRELEFERTPDSLLAAGEGSLTTRNFPKSDSQDVWAIFAETVLPIGDIGELQLAVRHEDYDVAGTTTDPKIAVQIDATGWLAFRASWGTSFQAPSLLQLTGNTTVTQLNDPFDNSGTCTVQNGDIVPTGISNGTVTNVTGGGLAPQSADSYNFGVLFNFQTGLAVSLDYWRFEYEDVISQEQGFQAIVDNDCLDNGVRDDPRVIRDPSGQLSVVNAEFINVGQVETDGIDFNASYDLNSRIGLFQFSALATLITTFDVNVGGQGFEDQLGNRNFRNGFGPTPELRYNVGATWTQNNHIANITVRYIDDYDNDQIASKPTIDDFTTIDAYYAYTFNVLNDSVLTMSVGMNNITDEDPPGLPTGQSGTQRFNSRPGFDGQVHDIRGRITYVRLKYQL